jgi:hypothetical protein
MTVTADVTCDTTEEGGGISWFQRTHSWMDGYGKLRRHTDRARSSSSGRRWPLGCGAGSVAPVVAGLRDANRVARRPDADHRGQFGDCGVGHDLDPELVKTSV